METPGKLNEQEKQQDLKELTPEQQKELKEFEEQENQRLKEERKQLKDWE